MPDNSQLDTKYFTGEDTYNCPFCNRRNVKFRVGRLQIFDWTNTKQCLVMYVVCSSCVKVSMHLTFKTDLVVLRTSGGHSDYVWSVSPNGIDDAIFYSVPTSFFVMDENIPSILRDLFTEAEGCLKSNFLTGASACARKIVYELAVDRKAEGEQYADRIKSLKAKLPAVDPAYFDTLLTIQEVTSKKVHERALDNWEAKHLRTILASLYEVLLEIYVLPKIRETRRANLLALKDQLLPKGSK